MRKYLSLKNSVFLLIILLFANCSTEKNSSISEREVVIAWAELATYITKNTPANSPTYASRCMGYIGLTMYESVVNGFPSYQSLGGQLNGLNNLPVPESTQTYHWVIALNAGQASILRSVYNQTSEANKFKIDSLERLIHEQFYNRTNDQTSIEKSVDYGKSVAESIFSWSKTDGGHRGYLRNFDKDMTHPKRPGSWIPPLYAQSFSHYPLHPHWGENRTFLVENEEIETPNMIPYDTIPSSAYYQQYLAVYEKDKNLTQEDKEAAIWWGDDPDVTFTPPGHSFYLATQAIKSKKPDLITCTQTYAKVGLAIADAFINCWKWKYHFFSERPNTFIPAFIDDEWESFWPDPPFPAFPSGHAIQAAAAATVLAEVFGQKIMLHDSSHVGRERDDVRDVDFKPRSFTGFWQVAEETANSRFYGGIHTPQDNQVGLTEGSRIGYHVNALNWRQNSVQ